MIVNQKIVIDLKRNSIPPIFHAVQGDAGSRSVDIILVADGVPWNIPQDNVNVFVRYRNSDGSGGTYDTLPDGSPACKVWSNVLTATLAPETCAVPGKTQIVVTIIQGTQQLSTFRFCMYVDNDLSGGKYAGDYVNLEKWFETHQIVGPTGRPAEVTSCRTMYQASKSGTDLPTGPWLDNLPDIRQGEWLWSRTFVTFTSGGSISWYGRSREGKDGNGSVSSVNGISPDADGDVRLDVAALALQLLPVGSYYASNSPTSPAEMWGGTWERLEEGRTLISAGGSYPAGSTGGEAAVTLTAETMADHLHTSDYGQSNKLGTIGMSDASGTEQAFGVSFGPISPRTDLNITTSWSGGGAPHNNMMPYRAAYIWLRVA